VLARDPQLVAAATKSASWSARTRTGPALAVRVAYQGVPASYSDLTITKVFATRDVERLERVGCKSFVAAMDALEAGEVGYALLPIENTIAGQHQRGLRPARQAQRQHRRRGGLAVEHCLVGVPGAVLEQVRTVRSHPVALQQCQRFLDTLVGVTAESSYDTAGAGRIGRGREGPHAWPPSPRRRPPRSTA
jgi:prephenate dehydratase